MGSTFISHTCTRTRQLELSSQEGRKIIVLTRRTEHLTLLREMLGNRVDPCYVPHGRIPKKQRAELLENLKGLKESTAFVLLATGSLIGEGSDHPPLDTLVPAMPISWKGTLQQYAGRLHCGHAGKQDCVSMILSSINIRG